MDVRLLGPVEVVAGGQTITFARPKERAVLAALALRPGEVVSESTLYEALWGEDPPATADKALQTHVSRLRKALGSEGAVIETHPGGYCLAAHGLLTDVGRAEQLLAAARQSHDAAERAKFLAEAAALWRGRSLGDLGDEPFAAGEAARLDELRAVITEERIDAELALGHHADVIAELEARCVEQPLRERLWSQRMLALFRAGRQAEALRAYQELRTRLADEFGLEPSQELRDLDAAIARGDLTLAPTVDQIPMARTASSTAPLPSGIVTFLLTDIEGSTRMWQADEAAMRVAVARHDEILRAVITERGGTVFSTSGDALAAAFASALDAIGAACAGQELLGKEAWPTKDPIRVRMGLHSGEAQIRNGDYFGTAVNRAARLMAVAHGGQVLCSASAASLVEGDIELVDLGEHHLRDLDRPMRVHQVGTASFPPLQSLDTFPSNLPAQLTSFIGRDEDLVAVASALQTSRLVSLTGTGGVGKTRLAIQAAADAVTEFPDGVWLCELAAAADPEAMSHLVALALGLTPRQGLSLPQAIAEFLATRRLLLVLDNCEHLLDPAADLVATLLARCPNVHVIATSREALGVPGEQVLRLRSLAVPPTDSSLDELARTDATRLFLERAGASGVQMNFSDTDGRAIIEICRRLDGIPLAIELAAARVLALSPTEIAAHLDERFRLLTGGRRAALERHHTLRATVDWSYSLLTDAERDLFDCLGVFPSTFDVGGARAVAAVVGIDAWDVVDALASLVAKSMLVADRNAEGATRYQMLETLRHYARERLDTAGRADACRRAHAQQYLTVATDIVGELRRGNEAPYRTRLAQELDNFRAAVAWGLDSTKPSDAEFAMGIISIFMGSGVAGSTGLYAYAEEAAVRAESCDPRYRGLLLTAAAFNAYMLGDFVRGKRWSSEALGSLAGSLAPGTVLAMAVVFTEADGLRSFVDESIKRLRAIDAEPYDYASFHSGIAAMAVELGDLEFAQAQATLAVELANASHSPLQMGVALYGFALAAWHFDPDAARTAIEECLRIGYQTIGTMAGARSRALALAAQLRVSAGDHEHGLETLAEAVAVAHADGDRSSMAASLARAVVVMFAVGDAETAAVLAGAVAQGAASRLHALPVPERPYYREVVGEIIEALGSEAYDAAHARGAAMAYDELVNFALEKIDTAVPHSRAPDAPTD